MAKGIPPVVFVMGWRSENMIGQPVPCVVQQWRHADPGVAQGVMGNQDGNKNLCGDWLVPLGFIWDCSVL
jgi:hypothetical protein